MEKVSQAWKDNQTSQLVSESFVEISFDITDPVSTDDAMATDNGSVAFSNTDDIINTSEEEIAPYATLEQNIWVLDGTKEILPQSSTTYKNAGYVSEAMGGWNGEFVLSPIVTISFSTVHEIPLQGITIVWSTTQGDYPTDFIVNAHKGGTQVAQKIVSGNTNMVSIVLFDIVDYDKITIAINKWCLPYRRARIEDILLGIRKVYTKKDLFSFTHSQEIDIISATLPKGTVSFEVNNYDREYDVYNMNGLAKYLTERQEVKVKYGYKINDKTEWIDGGVYYLSNWESKENTNSAKFEASLLFEGLSAIYDQGTYPRTLPRVIDPSTGVIDYPLSTQSLYDLAVDVLTFANLPLFDNGEVRWIIDESLKDIFTTSALPIDTVANCLQLIANAGCCILYQDRKGRIHIEKKEYTSDDYSINPTNSFSKPTTRLSKPIKNIKVSVYDNMWTGRSEHLGFVTALDLSTKEVWDFKVNYRLIDYGDINSTETIYITEGSKSTHMTEDTYYDGGYEITKMNFYSTYAEIQIVPTPNYIGARCSFGIRGCPVVTNSHEIDIPLQDVGEELHINNPLITSEEHARVVAEWVKNALSKRQTVSYSWRADPRLDAGDVVESVGVYDTNDVIMTKVDYSYNGAFKGTGEGSVI